MEGGGKGGEEEGRGGREGGEEGGEEEGRGGGKRREGGGRVIDKCRIEVHAYVKEI